MCERDYSRALERLEDIPVELVDFATEVMPRDLHAGIIYTLMGEPDRARASFEATRAVVEELVRKRPENGSAYGPLGLAYAGLGRRNDAIRAGKKGMKLLTHDAIRITELEFDLVLIHILLGEHDTALDHIDHLLSVPSWISVPFLEIFPPLDPLRDNPRFKKILDQYSGDVS